MTERLKDSPLVRTRRQPTVEHETGTLHTEGWRAVKTGKPNIAALGLEPGDDLAARALVAALLEDPEWAVLVREPTVRQKWTGGVVAAFIQERGFAPLELLYALSRRRKHPAAAYSSMLGEAYIGVEHPKMSDEERAARAGNREWYNDLVAERKRRDWA